MVAIDQIEHAVVQRLKAALPKIHVSAYPADLRVFLESFRHVNGALLVQYTGRERTHLARTRGMQTVSVEISAISKNLREHTGIYPLLDAAFVAVSGVALTNDESELLGVVLLQTEESFEMYLEKNGLWVYTQQYKSEEFAWMLPEESTDVLITEIQLQVNDEIETTIPEPDED